MSPVPQEVPLSLCRGHAAVLRNDAGHSGLSGAGRAVKDHIGDASAFNGAAEHPPRGQQVLLPADICQRLGAQTLRQWFIHRVSSSHSGLKLPVILILVYRISVRRTSPFLKMILR